MKVFGLRHEVYQGGPLAPRRPPPRRAPAQGPQGRGAWRYEFHACHDLPHQLDQLNALIDGFSHLYNTCRPHGAWHGLAPSQYLDRIRAAETPPSHMCMC